MAAMKPTRHDTIFRLRVLTRAWLLSLSVGLCMASSLPGLPVDGKSQAAETRKLVLKPRYPRIPGPVNFYFRKDLFAASALAISPDGRLLAVGTHDNIVRLWDLREKTLVNEFRGHGKLVSDMAFLPDGKTLVTASWDHKTVFWDVTSKKPIRTLTHKGPSLPTIAVSPDGGMLAEGARNGLIRLWNLVDGTLLREVKGRHLITSMAFSPDGTVLAAGTGEEGIRLFDPSRGTIVGRLEIRYSGARNMAFSVDGKILVTQDGWGIRFWDVARRRAIKEIRNAHDGDEIRGMNISSDGKLVATIAEDGAARIWDMASGQMIKEFRGHLGYGRAVVFSPDGKTLVTAGEDRTTRLWDMKTGKLLWILAAGRQPPGAIVRWFISLKSRWVVCAFPEESCSEGSFRP